MSDKLGLHRIANQSEDPDDYAVSLHLYTVSSLTLPQQARNRACRVYGAYREFSLIADQATKCRETWMPHIQPSDWQKFTC